jgi:signal transduction histidine kinase
LGLSIVAAIAARHGGSVQVDGSAFTLDVPAADG